MKQLMVPDRELVKSKRVRKLVMFEKTEGMVPFRLFDEASKYSSICNLPTSVGTFPVNLLSTSRMKTMDESRPISVGIVPGSCYAN